MFTGVGLTATSTGPATSVMLAGWATLRSSASTATAASTGTHGWHTAMTCERGPSTCRNSTTWSTTSSSPNGPCSRPTSRALCQSVTCTSWSGSSVRTVSVSRVAKCPDSGATTSTRGWGGAPSGRSLAKRSSVQNGVRVTTCSCTATARTPAGVSTPTLSIPKGSRSWVMTLSTKTWCAARSRRTGSRSAIGGGSRSSDSNAARDAARAPSSVTRCASYAAYSMRTPRTGRGPPSCGPRRRRRSHDNPATAPRPLNRSIRARDCAG